MVHPLLTQSASMCEYELLMAAHLERVAGSPASGDDRAQQGHQEVSLQRALVHLCKGHMSVPTLAWQCPVGSLCMDAVTPETRCCSSSRSSRASRHQRLVR